MKAAICIAVWLLIMVNADAQQITYKELATLQKAPNPNKFGSYVSRDGSLYMLGNKIKFGIPRGGVFTFIWTGDGVFTAVEQAPAKWANIETEITGIELSGNKKMGFKVIFKTRPIGGMINYKIDFESAVDVGEIVPYGMTSDQALSELKKAKDKLDLGLITQAKYDSIKTVLSKYIK